MDGLSKTFLFFIQILMTLMKLGDINVEQYIVQTAGMAGP